MQEIKKRRIVIASVLKPVDDTRMFEKIGRSLATVANVDVIGFGSRTSEEPSNLRQHPIGTFSRVSLERILVPWKILLYLHRLHPDVIVITTHELLIQSLLAKAILRCQVWYDIQENYARNIRYTKAFPPLIRNAIALWVRLKERLALPWIDHCLLAEQSYTTEMPYLVSRSVVIENKFLPRDQLMRPLDRTRAGKKLLFSGTLSESTGVFIAIDLATSLFEIDNDIEFTVVGNCPKREDYDRLIGLQTERPFMKIIGGNQLVPYDTIREQIDAADFGIISYPPNPSTSGTVPTKLYEYLANRLPILLIRNSRWEAITRRYHAAVVFEPNSFSAAAILHALRSGNFYTTDPQDVYWQSEEVKLLQLLEPKAALL